MATFKEGVRTYNTSSISLSVDSISVNSGDASYSNQLVFTPLAADYTTTVKNAAVGQACTITIPDPGASSASFVLTAGTNASATFTAATITTATITTANVTTANITTDNITTGNITTANITNLKYGATPVPQVDPASCTIAVAAGASNVCTITIQLKDGSGTNMARIVPFTLYASSAANGLTLASAASTGFAVASGGMEMPGGDVITQGIRCMSSATGGCVLSLTDTGKQTSYLVLVVGQGTKISAQLSAGDYGA